MAAHSVVVPTPHVVWQEVSDVYSRHSHRVTVAALVLALLIGTGAPAAARPGSAGDQHQAPETSGERETETPPPDPEGDIDPYRPSDGALIEPRAVAVRPIHFPLSSYSSYVDTFGACRDGCSRTHQGNDIFTPKLTPVIAAADGYVTWLRTDASGTAGNGVGITDPAGWRYLYLHINNDSPGTDNGANPARWRFIPGLKMGTKVYAGQIIGYSGDSGNAEGTPPHLHFEIRDPNQVNINPYPSLRAATFARPLPRLFRFDQLRGGQPSDHLAWATTATTAVMACDTDANGTDSPVFRQGSTFWASPSATDLRVVLAVNYGTTRDRGFCGDWDGNGTVTPGVRRGALYLLRNSWTSGPADVSFVYGSASDQMVVGDWNGDGRDTIGVVRGNRWMLTNRNASGNAAVVFSFGRAGDRAMPGDWNGNGVDTAGVQRGNTLYLRDGTRGGAASRVFALGTNGDVPVVATWPSGRASGDTISVWRRYPR